MYEADDDWLPVHKQPLRRKHDPNRDEHTDGDTIHDTLAILEATAKNNAARVAAMKMLFTAVVVATKMPETPHKHDNKTCTDNACWCRRYPFEKAHETPIPQTRESVDA